MSVGDCRGRKSFRSLILGLSLSLLAAGVGCGGSSSLAPGGSTKALTALAASPGTASIAVGATEQFNAMATYSDGSTANVTASAHWTDADPKVATIGPSGDATAVAAGSTTVTATLDGMSGNATLTVGAAAKTLTAIAVSPATASIAAGATQQFTAKATYSDSSTADVTATVAWTTSNAAVAKINAAGLLTAQSSGSVTVTATLDSVSGSATVTVPVAVKTLTSIALSPGTVSIAAKTTQQFTATGNYSDGSKADVTGSVVWTTANPAVATVNPSGLATAVAAGSTTVTASLSGITGSATLTVTPVLSSIAVSPNPASIMVGATQQFTATATYSDGSKQNITAGATWTAANPAVATVNAAGLATALAPGTTAITASLSGVSGSATLNVPRLTSIAVSPASPSIAVGATQPFTATATYSDGTTQNVTAKATWTAANPAVATVNASGVATAIASGTTGITASLNGISGTATLNVTGLTISVTPNPATVVVGATQQFTAKATYPDGSTGDVTATAAWSVDNTAVATVNATTGLATGVAAGSTTVRASFNGASGSASVTVTIAANSGVNIPTWHVDNNRSGLNPYETSLTPTNVASPTFGKLFSLPIDGYAYAEPLLMSNITISGVKHNVLYVATENDSVYAFDADTYGAPLWQVSLLKPGEAPIGGPIKPYEGVTSTPVIDTATNTIYVVSVEKPSGGPAGFRLNALDITTGAQKTGSPVAVQASVQGTNSDANANGTISLPTSCIQRAALLLANGTIYMGFSSCHSGWLLSYDANTLAQTGVFNASPNIDGEGTYGGAGGVWMGSGGPVADSAGNVYISTGNGPWNTTKAAYGDSILKFSPTLQLLDYFTPEEYGYMNCQDSDLAAGGLMMVPGSGQIVGGGKMGKLYLLNTTSLGHENANDAGAIQTLYVEQGIESSQPYATSCTDKDALGNPLPNGKTWYVGGPNDSNGDTNDGINSYEIFGTSAYFNGSMYLGVTPTSASAPGVVRRFTYASPGVLTATQEFTPLGVAQQQPLNTRGTTPFISANGTNDGILWTIDQGQPIQSPQATTHATLYAYDATNLSTELYSSDTNSGDQAGIGIKFTSPIVANGKVYMSSAHDPLSVNGAPVANPQGEIDVYGLK